MDGEAEERMELKVASLVISVSSLMVAAVWKLADANVVQGTCKGVLRSCSRFCSLQYGIC